MVCAPNMSDCAVFNHAVFAVVVVDAVAAVVVRTRQRLGQPRYNAPNRVLCLLACRCTGGLFGSRKPAGVFLVPRRLPPRCIADHAPMIALQPSLAASSLLARRPRRRQPGTRLSMVDGVFAAWWLTDVLLRCWQAPVGSTSSPRCSFCPGYGRWWHDEWHR